MAESFTTSLTVDKNIVEILSRSTYQRNFSYALREMVSNSYDADATRVSIAIDRKNNSLTIHDNGNGMTREEFYYYLRIAGKKRGKLTTTRFRRKRIGQFGVGFLAVFPFCQTLKVTTSTENSDQILTANIPTADFFAKPFAQFDVESVPVNGVIRSEPRRMQEHFTTITFAGLTPLAKDALSSTRSRRPDEQRRRTASIWDLSPIDRLTWELCDELPIAFPTSSKYREVFRYPESQIMEVDFSGHRLFRNDVLGDLLDSGDFSVAGVKCKYAICTPWKAVKPWEMRDVKIRLNNVGIGPRTEFDVSRTRAYSRLHWLSGELHIIEGLEDVLSVSRDAFVESESYNAVRSHMAKILTKQAFYVESVEESSISITKQLTGGKQVSVAAKKEVINKGVQRLVGKGFTTVRKAAAKRDEKEPAVTVDRKRRIVTIIEGHPAFRDQITVAGKTYDLTFAAFGTEHVPCRFEGTRTITLNSDFPLFESRRYGELFKKFAIISMVARKSTHSVEAMLQSIFREMEKQFTEYR